MRRTMKGMLAAGILVLGGCPSQPSQNNTPPTATATAEPDPVCELSTGPAQFDVSFLPHLYSPSNSTVSVPAGTGVTYYVDATAGSDGNSGTSPETAWKSLYHVSRATLQPGDNVLFKRGETWKDDVLDVPASGAADRPITFGAYGTGAKPVIDVTVPVPGADQTASWTAVSNQVWAMTPPYNEHPGRLWLSGQEHVKANSLDLLDSTYRWFYDSTAPGKLYVWSEGNPATTYSSVVKAWAKGSAIRLAARDHIVIQNLDLRGGGYTLDIQGCDFVTVENCDIGWGAKSIGVWISELEGNPTAGASNYGILRYNRIDCGYRLKYNYEKAQTEDGIHLRGGANFWQIHDNMVSDWGHTGICLWQHKAGTSVNHNQIHRNYMTTTHVSYGRGFSTIGRPGGCSNNDFAYNIVRETSVQNQIGGDYNTVRFNLIDTLRATPISPLGQRGLSIQSSQSGNPEYVADRNEITNNLLYRIDGPGIEMHEQHGASVMNNVVANNLLLDTGINHPDSPNVAMKIGADTQDPTMPETTRLNVYKDNLMFNRSGPCLVLYHGKRICPGSLDSKNGDYGDTCSGNRLIDPKLKAPEAQDFSPLPDSPLR